MEICAISNTDLHVSQLTFGERLDQAEAGKAVAAKWS